MSLTIKDYYEINKIWAKNIAWIDWLKSLKISLKKKLFNLKKLKIIQI